MLCKLIFLFFLFFYNVLYFHRFGRNNINNSMMDVSEMLNVKFEKYLLRKSGHKNIPVGILKYGDMYHGAFFKKDKQRILSLIDKEIEIFSLDRDEVYKIIRIE